jgi:hypothetical protein
MASQHPAPTIGDLINMTDTDTTEADDAIEQSDHRPIPPDAAFAIAFNLIALAADPRAFKKKLQGLHRALTAVDEGMARLAADRAAHDALVTKTTAELAEREKKLRAREVEHFAERGRFEETRKILRERPPVREHHPDDDGWTAPAGSGMSRTFTERRTVRRGPGDSSDFPVGTTLTRKAE